MSLNVSLVGVHNSRTLFMNYGHVTGQETRYGHGPYGLCGIDVFPEITAFSEQTGPPVVSLALRAGVGGLVYATWWR